MMPFEVALPTKYILCAVLSTTRLGAQVVLEKNRQKTICVTYNQAMQSASQIKHYKNVGVPAGLQKCKASGKYRLPENWIERWHEEVKGPEDKRGA